ncbi:hypothetical protein [Streptantibioticus silvisoli]|uniref:DUF1211 domain-containing protein n=1 Tax=Streptantibioticus silvisoli TaxID=2705255 RepID=A0ABT6W4T1_9ACTN|nr:hypothetical protein [Streptantibioticus silvisoli]MDI5965731.1 hypothetical protein [Streptantibioticus silvisoli]
MLDAICYTIAFMLLALAALLPDTVPYRDRLAYAGLAAFVLPTMIHALH